MEGFDIHIGEKRLVALLIIYFSLLSSLSAIVVIADYFSVEPRSAVVWGVISDAKTDLGSGSTFYIKTAENKSYGQFKSSQMISNGQIAFLLEAKDAFDVPFFYPARTWKEILVDNRIVETTESHTPLYFIVGLWTATIGVSSLSLIRYYNHVRKHILEEKVKPR